MVLSSDLHLEAVFFESTKDLVDRVAAVRKEDFGFQLLGLHSLNESVWGEQIGPGGGSLLLVLAELCDLPLVKKEPRGGLCYGDLLIFMHEAPRRQFGEIGSPALIAALLSALLGQLDQSGLVDAADDVGGHLIEGLADLQIESLVALLEPADLQEIALMVIELPHGLQLALLQIPNLREILLFNQLFKV